MYTFFGELHPLMKAKSLKSKPFCEDKYNFKAKNVLKGIWLIANVFQIENNRTANFPRVKSKSFEHNLLV